MVRRNKILLVEDNPDDEALTLRAFNKNNILNEIVTVHDGAEALDYLLGVGAYAGRDPQEQPQFVLLDLQLPKIGGVEVLRRLRADPRTQRLPVVVLTSSNEDRDLVETYNLGTNAYVRKPVDFPAFVEAVRALHLFWMIVNEVSPS
jgi:two-component system response regulator